MRLFQTPRFFKKRKIKTPTVYLIPGLHFDPASQSTQAESVEQGIQLLRQYIQACRIDPYLGFYIPNLDLLRPYLDLYPEDKTFLKQLIEQERGGISGTFTPPSQTLVSGESLIRNLILGKHHYASLLEGHTSVFIGWDAYSHVPQLPQIIEQCGIKAAVFDQREHESESAAIPGISPLFYWMAPNGSCVYAYRTATRFSGELEAAIEQYKQPHDEPLAELRGHLLFDSSPMQPLRTSLIGKSRDWSQAEEPLYVTGKAGDKFFAALDTFVHENKLKLEPVTRDFTQGAEGADLSRFDLNLLCRRMENLLFETEALSVMAGVYGVHDSSSFLHHTWQQLLYCQQQNALGGWCSDIAYIDLLAICHETLTNLIDYRDRLVESFTALIQTSKFEGDPLFVFNPLPWRRDGVCSIYLETSGDIELYEVKDAAGEPVPFELEDVVVDKQGAILQVKLTWVETEIVSAGYQTLSVENQEEVQSPYIQLGQSQPWLENDFLRVEIDPDLGGGIISLLEKETGYEYIQSGQEYTANEVICLRQSADTESPRRLTTIGKQSVKSMHPAFVDYYESPVSQSLIIKGHGPGPCRSMQKIKLYHDLPYLDCTTVLENYQGYGKPNDPMRKIPHRDLYMLGFPLNLPGSIPVMEDRFYARAYHRSQGNFDYRGVEETNLSKHGMNTFYRWVDVSWSFLVRIIKNKEEVGGIAVGPSDVVTPSGKYHALREKLVRHLSRQGVSCSTRADHQNIGDDRLYRPCTFSIGSADENSFTQHILSKHEDARSYYNQSMAEFGYAVIIVPYRRGGIHYPVFLFAGNTPAFTEQAVDEIIHSTVAHRWDCPASGCFIPDLPVVKDAGFALINTGSTLCSVEENGTLTVAMMHTAPYVNPKTEWGLEFAEHKTHLFQYRLIPHEGDWRHAEIPRRAMEYQHPPLCARKTKQEGKHPASQSFFTVEPSNVLISAWKPPGLGTNGNSSKSGSVLRVYEAHGEESNLWIESNLASKQAECISPEERPLPKSKELFWEDGSTRTIIHSHEIAAFLLHFKGDSLSRPFSHTPAEAKAVPSRYWNYNLGAVSNGDTGVRVMLRGQVPTHFGSSSLTVYPIQVLISNPATHSVDGLLQIDAPPYWRVVPPQKKYQIKADGFMVVPALLIADQPTQNGVIRAHTKTNGFVVQDEMTVGQPPSFDVEMTLTAEAFYIHLSHHFPYPVQGIVQLIAPFETWSKRLMDDYALSNISLARQPFDLAPEKKLALEFSISDYANVFQIPTDHHWLVVKITAQYCNWYYHVRLDGRPSGGLGCVIRA